MNSFDIIAYRATVQKQFPKGFYLKPIYFETTQHDYERN